jgi:protein SCO1/2
MLKPTVEGKTPIMNTPVSRSTFLGYGALLLSAVGLGTAQAHSTGSRKAEARDRKSSEGAKSVSSRSHLKQRAYRHSGKMSDRFPNTLLHTQDNKPVRFYDDLIKNKTVIVDFMFASCDDDCPVKTINLVDVHRLLGRRVGRDILMLSISLEGKRDSPEALRQYMKRYGGSKPGWLYLTGDYDEIESLRYSLGVYDLDPVIDADKASHAGILTFGNDRTNRWAALPALMNSKGIARTISRITRDPRRTG